MNIPTTAAIHRATFCRLGLHSFPLIAASTASGDGKQSVNSPWLYHLAMDGRPRFVRHCKHCGTYQSMR